MVAEDLGAGEVTNPAPVRMAIAFVLTAVIDKPISLGSDVWISPALNVALAW
ncbi:MAG: hypothetical protein Kow0088_17250 [Anaerolineales bacterium]